MNGKQAIKALEKLGFRIIRINGSHHMLTDGTRRVNDPSNFHYGSIAVIPAWMPESSAMDGNLSVA